LLTMLNIVYFKVDKIKEVKIGEKISKIFQTTTI